MGETMMQKLWLDEKLFCGTHLNLTLNIWCSTAVFEGFEHLGDLTQRILDYIFFTHIYRYFKLKINVERFDSRFFFFPFLSSQFFLNRQTKWFAISSQHLQLVVVVIVKAFSQFQHIKKNNRKSAVSVLNHLHPI